MDKKTFLLTNDFEKKQQQQQQLDWLNHYFMSVTVLRQLTLYIKIKKYCQRLEAHLKAYLCNGTFGKRERGLPWSSPRWGDTERERWWVVLCCSGTVNVVDLLSLALDL